MSVGMAAPPAVYGSDPGQSRGRRFNEPPSLRRSAFRRDCDRVIHSNAFRRLKHKTQVFVFHEGDHYRTRLTHTLEVAQIARALARQLGLDEDLTETLALAHDLGHPPFGHAGERALDECLRAHGGFDHNAQSLRVVTLLERRYPQFDGLNLTWESLEGIVKHNGPLIDRNGEPVGRYREHGVPVGISEYVAYHDLELWSYASLEAQVAAVADDIAYDAHDIDDGLRAGLFTVDDLGAIPLIADINAVITARYPRRRTGARADFLSDRGRVFGNAPAAWCGKSRQRHRCAQLQCRAGRVLEGSRNNRGDDQAFPQDAHVPPRAGHARDAGRGGRGARSVRPLSGRTGGSARRMAAP